MARKNIWEQIWESTEGPTVTVTIPRDHAESLLQVLAASLEQDMPDDGMGGDGEDMDDMDLDSVSDLDFDGADGGDMGSDDLDMMPAGDEDSDDMGDMGDDLGDEGPAHRGPGRPPGSKNKKKSDGGEKKSKKDDDGKDKKDKKDDDEPKEEAAGEYRPQTALGESAFARAARALARPRRKR